MHDPLLIESLAEELTAFDRRMNRNAPPSGPSTFNLIRAQVAVRDSNTVEEARVRLLLPRKPSVNLDDI